MYGTQPPQTSKKRNKLYTAISATSGAVYLSLHNSSRQQFYDSSISTALKYGYKGYSIDLEGGYVNSSVSQGILSWLDQFATILHKNGMSLTVFIHECPNADFGLHCTQLNDISLDDVITMVCFVVLCILFAYAMHAVCGA